MKTKLLSFLVLLLFSGWTHAQITGSTTYSLESAIISQGNTEATIAVADANALTFNQGTAANPIDQNGAHGAIMSNGNTITMHVGDISTVTFTLCQYSAAGSSFTITDADGKVLGTIDAKSVVDETDVVFSYADKNQILTFTLNATGSVYLHQIKIDNAKPIIALNGKTEAWDFGAEQLPTESYINNLTVSSINAWYTYGEGQVPGGTGRNTPKFFTSGSLDWNSSTATSDRLRTTNTSLTRYDENISTAGVYTGRLYVNGTSGRSVSLTLSADDQVTLVMKSDAGATMKFEYVADPTAQTDQIDIPIELKEDVVFVAKKTGVYKIYNSAGKPSFYRILRKNAVYIAVTGTVTAPEGIPEGYGVVFTNDAGKSWIARPVNNSYSVNLPKGFSYNLGVVDANGYVITSSVRVTVNSAAAVNITLAQIDLKTLTGSVTGLGSDLSNLILKYSPVDESKIFNPTVKLNNSTGEFSVLLEPNVAYNVSAEGVNDYSISSATPVTITADDTKNVEFTAKPTFEVTANITGLSTEQLAALNLTFTNLNEEGYSYTFTDVAQMKLRNGVYSITVDELDAYAVELALTSNLVVDGSATSKDLNFQAVSNWSFDDKAFNSTMYKGLLLNPAASNELGKGHLIANVGTTITVPITTGQKLIVTYYYSAGFTIDGGTEIYTTQNSTGSTNSTDVVEYIYEGTGTSIDLVVTDTKTYFFNIQVIDLIPYSATITVGTDKDYPTINEALTAISKMIRPNNERVNVMVDPGNYEEMLVVNSHNVSLSNASSTPSYDLKDAGVHIDDNAVRITSYYGHGYNYYSMGNNQKWNADKLRVNKENGSISYENTGGGTTNGSYWNATVVVFADGFEANSIIFENSYNQYISKKESEDVVVETTGGKGTRPTTMGSTAVQNKSFVERACAIAVVGGDKMVLNSCKVIGRQDAFYGGIGSRVAVFKGVMMGGTDYIFGGMTAVFYQSKLALNTSEDPNDVAYITAGQQGANDRGYLMYECTVTSATSGLETASAYRSKPGSFGRCWSGSTTEVLFYNTTIETSNNPSFDGLSLITPTGWTLGLGGPSLRVGEFGTIENSGIDNSANRYNGAEVVGDWGTTVLTSAVTRGDAIELTPFNFTKGNDDWNPFPTLIANDPRTTIPDLAKESEVNVFANTNRIYISNVSSEAIVEVFNLTGSLVKSFEIRTDANFEMSKGLWVVRVKATDGQRIVKVLTY